MQQKQGPIGALDTGIGGLTVVQELQRLAPGEDIVYFGDSANCPYGNKTAEQIIDLSQKMLRFLGKYDIKAAAIGCNTISTLISTLEPHFSFPLVGIIRPTADYVASLKIGSVGLVGTDFTVSNRIYDRLIAERDPSIEVIAEPNSELAALVDLGDFSRPDFPDKIRGQVDRILRRGKTEHLILGCSHYPIIENVFQSCYPQITMINPAREQARALCDFLARRGALAPDGQGSLTIYTTGNPEIYRKAAQHLGLRNAVIHHVDQA